jgi:hypothetical protein
MEDKYYLPMKSENLADYFSKGIICPANYITNRNEDIQTLFKNKLLLSNSKFTFETDCAIEIVFNRDEESPKAIKKHFFLFDMPLPISRVKSIIFKTEEQKNSTVFNIESGAAFLPKTLIEVDSLSEPIETKELEDADIDFKDKKWSTLLNKFNRVLGGIAVMSIAKSESFNYGQNFFNTLSFFNKKIEKQFSRYKKKNKLDYSWAFDPNGSFNKLYQIIYSDIDDKILQEIAFHDDIKLETRNGLYLIEKIPSNKNTYLAAILVSYGENKRKKLDSFISDFQTDKFLESKKEGLALIFGINKGYEAFRNKYKTQNFQEIIKFKLDSQLDYYVIESIYQSVFNNKFDNREFPYIDTWCPRYENPTFSNLEIARILDKDIIIWEKKTEDSLDSFQVFFNDSAEIRNEIYEKISAQICKWLPPFVSNNSKIASKYFGNELGESLEYFARFIFDKTKDKLVDLENQSIDKDLEIEFLKQRIKEQSFDKTNLSKKRVSTEVPNNIGLFNKTSHLSNEEQRADELYELKITKLKEVAKKYNIKSLSIYKKNNKQKLIDEIIKIEFKK